MKSSKKKLICLTLITLLLIAMTGSAAFATEQPDEQPITVSMTAGENGYYLYDIETEESVFVDPSEYGDADAEPIPASEDLLIEDPPEIAPFGVIGNDDRTKVSSPSGRYESTCLIGIRFPDDYIEYGTGWLINDSYVATAAHMLYKSEHGGYGKHVAVYVGSSGGTYKTYRLGHSYAIGGDYKNNEYNSSIYNSKGMFDDWGVVKLTSAVSGVGHLGRYAVNSHNDMKNRTYYTQGYPKDKNSSKSKWNDCDMYTCSGKINGNVIQSRYLPVVYTDIDIYEGQSGSPVYSYRSGYGYTAEGIVVAGSSNANCVILLNNWLYNYFSTL